MRSLISIIMLFSLVIVNGAGEHPVLFNIELNETAINRALQFQYSMPDFPSTVHGNIPGTSVTYTLQLKDDFEIIFDVNTLKIKLPISISSSLGNYDVIINPTLVIPNIDISLSQIEARISNLSQQVDGLNIPSWAKDIILYNFENYQPYITTSKLVDVSNNNSEWLIQRGIDVNDIELVSVLESGKLHLSLIVNLHSEKPRIRARFKGIGSVDYISFNSNIKVRVDEVNIYNLDGSHIKKLQPYCFCMPSEDKDISLGLNMVTANYIAKVIFTIDNEDSDPNTVQTFYTRYYVT